MANVTLGLPESTGVRVFYDNAVSGIQVQSLTSTGNWTELQKLNISTLNNDSNFLTELDLIELSTAVSGLTSDYKGLTGDVVTVSTNLSTLTENFNVVSSTVSSKIDSISGSVTLLQLDLSTTSGTLTKNIGIVSGELSKVSGTLTNNIKAVSGDLSDLDTEFKQVSGTLTNNIKAVSGEVDTLNITINNLPVEFLSSLTPEQYNVLTDGLNNLWKLEDNTYSLNIPVSSLPSYLQASHSATNLSSFVTNVIDNMNFATVTPLAEFINSFDDLSSKLESGELNNRTIYLVPNGKDSLDEYIVVSSKLELLGPAEINIENYVLKEDGKGLSTNDYTNDDKTKLTGIESGAQVNKIETIKLNGNILSISDKSVNIDLSQYALSSELFSGSYDDLTDKPTIPTKVTDLSDHTNYVLNADIKGVAKTGSYTDLTNRPTSLSSFTNDVGYITSSAIVAKAKALETGRKIALTGAVVGSAQFDGSQDVVINAALGDSITIDASKISGLTVDFNKLLNIPSGQIVNKSIKFDGQIFAPAADNESIDISDISGLLKLNWNNITNKPALATTGELSEVSSILTGQIKENEEYAQTVSSTLLKDINTISSNLLEVSETVSSLPVEFLSSLTPEQYNVLTDGLNNLWKLEGNEYSLVLPEYLNANSPNASNLSAFVSGVVNDMGVKILHPVYEVVLNFDTLKNWCENKQVVDSSGNTGWILNTETIYLVPSEKDSGTYDEYLCIPNANNGVVTGWTLEQIGNTKVDLSGYATLGQISSFITSGDVIARAVVADKLSNGRKIDLTGIVSGSAQFDGSKDISINVTLADGIAWSDITSIPSSEIYNTIDKIKYNDTEFDITDKTVDLSNLSGVFQVKGDYQPSGNYLASKITSKDYDPNGQLSDIFGSPASQNTTELKVVVPNNVIVGSANKTGIAAIWDTENEEWISLSQSSTNTISEQNADLLPTVSAVIDYVAKHSPTGPTYTEGAGISLTNNAISILAATSGTLGGVKSGGNISVNTSGEVTVLQANKVKSNLTINGKTYNGSSPVSITAISGVADNSLEIDDPTKPTSIKVKISDASGNQLSLKGDGLYVKLPEVGSGSSANIVVGEWNGEQPSIPSAETGLYFDKTEEIPWIYDGNTKEWFDLSVPPILSSAIEEGVVEPLYIASVGSVISYVNNKFSDKTLSYFSDEPSGNNKDYYINCIPTVSAVIEYTNEKLSGIKLQPGLSGDILTNGIGIAISQISGNALTIKDGGLYVKQSSGSSTGSTDISAGHGLYLMEGDESTGTATSIGIDLFLGETNGIPGIGEFTGEPAHESGFSALFIPASVVPLSGLSEDKTPYKNMIAVSGNNTAIYLDGTASGKQLGIPVVDNINPTETDISETVPTVEAVINYVGSNAGGGNSGGTENGIAGVSSLIFTLPNLMENESAKLSITDLYDDSISDIILSANAGEILDNPKITGALSGSIFSKLTLKVPLTGSLTGLSDYRYQWIISYDTDDTDKITEISGLYAYGSVYGQQVPGSVTSDDVIFNENAGIYDGSTLTQVVNDLESKVFGTRNYVNSITFESNTCNEISGAFTGNTDITFNIPSDVSNATCIFQTALDWAGEYKVEVEVPGKMFVNKPFAFQQNKQAMYIINVDKNIITWTMLEPIL